MFLKKARSVEWLATIAWCQGANASLNYDNNFVGWRNWREKIIEQNKLKMRKHKRTTKCVQNILYSIGNNMQRTTVFEPKEERNIKQVMSQPNVCYCLCNWIMFSMLRQNVHIKKQIRKYYVDGCYTKIDLDVNFFVTKKKRRKRKRESVMSVPEWTPKKMDVSLICFE